MSFFSKLFSRLFGKPSKKADEERTSASRECGCMFDEAGGKWYRGRFVNGRCEPYGIPYSSQSECEALNDSGAGSGVA